VFVVVVLFFSPSSSLLFFFSLSAHFSAPSTAWIVQLSSALSFLFALCIVNTRACRCSPFSRFLSSSSSSSSPLTFTHVVVVMVVVAIARKRAGGQADHDRQGGTVLLPHPSQLHRSSCHLHVNANNWPTAKQIPTNPTPNYSHFTIISYIIFI
jgi:hypothetical protein